MKTSSSRPSKTIYALILAGLLLMGLLKLGFRLLDERSAAGEQIHLSFSPHQEKSPWASEPVADPILAEVLLPGATVQYYEAVGNSRETIEQGLAAHPPGAAGQESKTIYRLVLRKGDPSDGSCGFATAQVRADIAVVMPRWVAMPNATDDAKQWWNYRIRELARQEQHHIDQAVREAREADLEIRASGCGKGDTVLTGINARLLEVHRTASSSSGGPGDSLEMLSAIEEASSVSSPSVKPLPISKGPERTGSGLLPRGVFTEDYAVEMTSLDGIRSSLENQRGRVIFLNFWATWCGPCRSEMPSLEKLFGRLRGHNIFFAGLSQESSGALKAFISNNDPGLPTYRVTPAVAGHFNVRAIPTTIIISKKGDWVLRQNGTAPWDSEDMVKVLTDLENE